MERSQSSKRVVCSSSRPGATGTAPHWWCRCFSWASQSRGLLLDVLTTLLGNAVLLTCLCCGLRFNFQLCAQLSDGIRIKQPPPLFSEPYLAAALPGTQDSFKSPELPFLWLDLSTDIIFVVVQGCILLRWFLLRLLQLCDAGASGGAPWPDHYLVRPAQQGLGLLVAFKKFGLLWSYSAIRADMVYQSSLCGPGFVEDSLRQAFHSLFITEEDDSMMRGPPALLVLSPVAPVLEPCVEPVEQDR